MIESMSYAFKVGGTFLIKVLPPKDGEIMINVRGLDLEKYIPAGTFSTHSGERKHSGFMLGEIPDGDYKVLLERIEEDA